MRHNQILAITSIAFVLSAANATSQAPPTPMAEKAATVAAIAITAQPRFFRSTIFDVPPELLGPRQARSTRRIRGVGISAGEPTTGGATVIEVGRVRPTATWRPFASPAPLVHDPTGAYDG